MDEENPSSAGASPEKEAEKKPGEDGDAPRPPPPTQPSSSRTRESAPPNRGACSDAQDKVAEAAPAGPLNAPDGRSFSQLLAGAMAGPSQTQASLGTRHPPPPPPILTVPVVAVPCFLAPAALIESPGFAGQFAMTHQAVLATVTAQAQMQLQASYPAVSADSVSNSFPQPMLSTVSQLPLQTIPASASASETTSSDVYHWRKYGQKQVKSSENSRSYYRCTDSNCFAKKKVERSPNGTIVQTVYGGKHNHEPPQKYKYTRERLAQSAVHLGEGESLEQSSIELKESDRSASKVEQNSGNEAPQQHLYCSSDCEVDTGSKNEEDVSDEPDSKRRIIEGSKIPSTPALKTVREYIVRTEIDARHLSDGYRWRKYGQKVVKGNPNPRSYYRCTYDGCPVRKHVEKVPHDPKALLITYEGQHNHDQPSSKYSSDHSPPTPKSNSASAVVGEQPTAGDALVDTKSSEDPNVSKVDRNLADGKASELGGDNALESAQALLSIGLNSSSGEGADRTSLDSMKTSLLNENQVPVSVHNS